MQSQSALSGHSTRAVGLVRDGRRDFSLPGREVAEHDENRDQEDQRKTAADDPDGNIDRQRICDADGVAKNVDQFFMSFSARPALKGGLVYKLYPSCQEAAVPCPRSRSRRADGCPLLAPSGHRLVHCRGKADIDNEKIYNCRKPDQPLCDQCTTQFHFIR